LLCTLLIKIDARNNSLRFVTQSYSLNHLDDVLTNFLWYNRMSCILIHSYMVIWVQSAEFIPTPSIYANFIASGGNVSPYWPQSLTQFIYLSIIHLSIHPHNYYYIITYLYVYRYIVLRLWEYFYLRFSALVLLLVLLWVCVDQGDRCSKLLSKYLINE
jgi:hypothetical protein